MLENLIEDLGKELQITDKITSKTPGEYTIAFDKENTILLSSFEGGYLVHCSVAPCPKQNKELFYNLVMEGNLFGQASYGAVLGLSEEDNNLTLSLELDYNTSYKEFKEKIEDFLNIADFWRKKASEF